MKYIKINNQNIYEEIAEHIKSQILNGTLQPGERLPSAKELSESYKVGRSTIREALNALKVMGLIDIRQGERSTVNKINSEDFTMPDFQSALMSKETILELMEARKLLEISNVELAAQKRTKEDLQSLKVILRSMEENIDNDIERDKADMLFHKKVAIATQNKILIRMLETISEPMGDAMQEVRQLYLRSDALIKKGFEDHCRIYQAIVDKDSKLAREEMIQHLDHFEETYLSYFEKKENK